jgi:hypothetical protein
MPSWCGQSFQHCISNLIWTFPHTATTHDVTQDIYADSLPTSGNISDPRPSPTAADMNPSQVTVVPSGGDDQPNLQAAVNSLTSGGTVVLSSGTYQLKQTWKIPGTSPTSLINITGTGGVDLRPFSATTPPDDGLIRIERNWGYKVEGLQLIGGGSGIGLWLASETDSGTQGGQAVIERVSVSGFSSGFRLGTSNKIATSELIFSACKATNCDIGMELLDFNTLDVLLNMWSMGLCRVGVFTSSAGDVHVVGGSASSNKTDFELDTGGTFSVNKFRSEGVMAQFLHSGATTARTNILLESCEVMGPADPATNPVIVCAGGNALTTISCFLSGFILWGQSPTHLPQPPNGTITMISTFVQDGPKDAPHQPFRVDPPNSSNAPYRIFGCSWRGLENGDANTDGWFPDQTGVIKDAQLVPTWQADTTGTFTLANRPVVQGSWADGSAGKSLCAALATLGLIVNETT